MCSSDLLEELIPSLHPRFRPAERSPVAVYHPALALLLVDQVIVKGISPIEPGSIEGTWEQKLSVQEYSPPRDAPTNALLAGRRTSFARDTAFPPPTGDQASTPTPAQTGAGP